MTESASTGYISALVGPNGIRRTDRDPRRRYTEQTRRANEARDCRARGLRVAWDYVDISNRWASQEDDPEMIILEAPPLEALEAGDLQIIAEHTAAGHPLAFLGCFAGTLAHARCDAVPDRPLPGRAMSPRATRWPWPPQPAPGPHGGAHSSLMPISCSAGRQPHEYT